MKLSLTRKEIKNTLKNPWVVSLSWALGLIYYHWGRFLAKQPAVNPSSAQFSIFIICGLIYCNYRHRSPVFSGFLTGMSFMLTYKEPVLINQICLVISLLLLYIYQEDKVEPVVEKIN